MIFNLFLAAMGQSTVVAISDQSLPDANVDPGVAGVTYAVNSDGTVSYSTVASGSGTIENWVNPTSAAGANYEVRVTKNSGTNPSGSSLATWLALSSSRSWTIGQSGLGNTSCNLTVEIRDASTLVMLDSATVEMIAEVTL